MIVQTVCAVGGIKEALERLQRRRSTPQSLVKRVKIILELARGTSVSETARRIKVGRRIVHKWGTRWGEAIPRMESLEGSPEAKERTPLKLIEEVLSDAPRPGMPPKCSAEQVTEVIAIACEPPDLSGRPVTHWTPRELADEAAKRQVLEKVSPRQVKRWLDEAKLQPHRSRYRLNANPDDPEVFREQVNRVCDIYQQAPDLKKTPRHEP